MGPAGSETWGSYRQLLRSRLLCGRQWGCQQCSYFLSVLETAVTNCGLQPSSQSQNHLCKCLFAFLAGDERRNLCLRYAQYYHWARGLIRAAELPLQVQGAWRLFLKVTLQLTPEVNSTLQAVSPRGGNPWVASMPCPGLPAEELRNSETCHSFLGTFLEHTDFRICFS